MIGLHRLPSNKRELFHFKLDSEIDKKEFVHELRTILKTQNNSYMNDSEIYSLLNYKQGDMAATELEEEDPIGPLLYVAAVLSVYSLSIFLFIVSMIKKSRHNEDAVEMYIRSISGIRQEERRQQKRRVCRILQHSIEKRNKPHKKQHLHKDILRKQSGVISVLTEMPSEPNPSGLKAVPTSPILPSVKSC